MISTHLETFLPFQFNSQLPSAIALNLEQSKICRLGKGNSLDKIHLEQIVLTKASLNGLHQLTWVNTVSKCVYSLPNDKTLDLFKLKAFADDNYRC